MRSSFARAFLPMSFVSALASANVSAQSEAPTEPPPPAPPPYEPAPSAAPVEPSVPPGTPPTGAFPSEPATGSFPSPSAQAAPPPSPPPPPPPPPALPPSASVAPPAYEPEPQPAPATDWSVPQAEHGDRKRDDSDGLLGPFRIGPVIGVGMPNLIHFGGTMKLTKYFGAGLNIGVIPAIRLSIYGEAKLSYQEYDIYGRIYPFGGGFYFGAGVGYETVKGTIKDSVNASSLANEYPDLGIPDLIEYQADGRVRTLILTPQIGYFHTAKSGFSVGLFIGAQIPIAPSDIEFETTVEGLPEVAIERYVAPLDRKVRDTLETVARQPLPSFGVQLGWLL